MTRKRRMQCTGRKCTSGLGRETINPSTDCLRDFAEHHLNSWTTNRGTGATFGTSPRHNGTERTPRTAWRRGWDSNPRGPFRPNGFQDRRIQPLCHPSGFERIPILARLARLTTPAFLWLVQKVVEAVPQKVHDPRRPPRAAHFTRRSSMPTKKTSKKAAKPKKLGKAKKLEATKPLIAFK
jgi:hypothetical protein